MQKLLLSLILLISSLSVLACPTGKIQYNDDSALSSEGIHDLSDGSLIPVKDMKEDYLKNRRYSLYGMANSQGELTHDVKFLGTMEDDEGILFTTYLVKDHATGEEKVVQLSSSYFGNGMFARGGSRGFNKTDDDFKSLHIAGCN